MGYSCRQDADEIYKQWLDYCYASTGVSNSYLYKNERYCLQLGRQQDDGAMTGTVMLLVDHPHIPGQYLAHNKGSFRIEPDGTVKRYPTGLKYLLAGVAA